MKQEKSEANFQSRGALVAMLTLAAVIFTPLFWAAESWHQAAATAPQLQPVATPSLSYDQGKSIFEQKCRGCHSIGEGKLIGPDLKGIISRRDREWLIRFIIAPDQLIAAGDPIAEQLVAEYGGFKMPNMGLSESEAEEVLTYIEAQSGGEPAPPIGQGKEPIPAAPSGKTPSIGEVTSAPSGDAKVGRDIFTGTTALKNGGAACISCHNVSAIGALGGGSVGKGLDGAYASLGEQGLTSLLKSTPFPIMKELYAEQPLTDEEVTHLVAFLQEAGREELSPPQNANILIVISIAVLLFILGIFQLFWRGRLAGVRQLLVRGGSR